MSWLRAETEDEAIAAILDVYEIRGHDRYDEVVTQVEHALQSAVLADREGASQSLIAAALLHDIGHLAAAEKGANETDLRHERIGSTALGRWFTPGVTDPIRLHVQAKRYLCAVEDGYRGCLSPASIESLRLQGSAMSSAERVDFESEPHAEDAIRLRRWDDLAKVPGAVTPEFGSFEPLLRALMDTGSVSG